MSKIFLTSDTHFNHDKPFVWGARGFNSVEEMNNTIIKKWNEVVASEDTVYHLGDVMLGDIDAGMRLLNKLNGHINIIAGNHDTDKRIKTYQQAGYSVVWADRIKYNHKIFMLTHYPMITSNFGRHNVINLYGHTHQTTNFYNADENDFSMYHVGMDSHNCTPVLLDDIINEINLKEK